MNSQTGATQSSGGGHTGLKYFLVGSGIGAAAALLFAPKAGAQLRSDIADVTKRGYDGTLDLARKVKEQSTDLYHSLLEGNDGEIAETAVSTAETSMNELANRVESTQDDLLSIDDQARSGNFGRKSTNIV